MQTIQIRSFVAVGASAILAGAAVAAMTTQAEASVSPVAYAPADTAKIHPGVQM